MADYRKSSNLNDLYTVFETAAKLRLKPSTIRDWILNRRISYVKLGGRVFIRRAEVEALIRASVVPAISTSAREGR